MEEAHESIARVTKGSEARPLLTQAIHYATFKHEGQTRKNPQEDPYIVHPIEVMAILFDHGITDETTLTAAVLHDVVEDTPASLEEVSTLFGPGVASVVSEVSDDKSLPKRTRKLLQMEHASTKSLAARLVKIGDKISNTKDLLVTPPEDWTDVQRFGYIAWSEEICTRAISAGGVPPSLVDHVEIHFKSLGVRKEEWLEPYFASM
jgi:guanosine-3',5'-bis(diphosphate) 3'-pyrophosphohydrolase